MGMEKTLVLIKPDAVKLNLVGDIMRRFAENEFHMLAMKRLLPAMEMVIEHYKEKFDENPQLREPIIEYLTSGILVAVIFERKCAILRARRLIGPLTNAPPGTVRGDFRSDQSDALHTLVHASDSSEAVEREINIWFFSQTTETLSLYRQGGKNG